MTPREDVFVTVNALRRYLAGRGCVELREFKVVGDDDGVRSVYVQVECVQRSGRACRGHFAYEPGSAGEQYKPKPLAELDKMLARCLGPGWTTRIVEDPFG